MGWWYYVRETYYDTPGCTGEGVLTFMCAQLNQDLVNDAGTCYDGGTYSAINDILAGPFRDVICCTGQEYTVDCRPPPPEETPPSGGWIYRYNHTWWNVGECPGQDWNTSTLCGQLDTDAVALDGVCVTYSEAYSERIDILGGPYRSTDCCIDPMEGMTAAKASASVKVTKEPPAPLRIERFKAMVAADNMRKGGSRLVAPKPIVYAGYWQPAKFSATKTVLISKLPL